MLMNHLDLFRLFLYEQVGLGYYVIGMPMIYVVFVTQKRFVNNPH
jgi:hypothetical protein